MGASGLMPLLDCFFKSEAHLRQLYISPALVPLFYMQMIYLYLLNKRGQLISLSTSLVSFQFPSETVEHIYLK
jgi:hypothetical protein